MSKSIIFESAVNSKSISFLKMLKECVELDKFTTEELKNYLICFIDKEVEKLYNEDDLK